MSIFSDLVPKGTSTSSAPAAPASPSKSIYADLLPNAPKAADKNIYSDLMPAKEPAAPTYETMSKDYTAKKSSFDSSIKDFETKESTYKKQVEDFNTKGGTSEDLTRLNSMAQELNTHANELKTQHDELNGMVEPLNTLARNKSLDEYKAKGGAVLEAHDPKNISADEKQQIEERKLPFYTRAIDNVLDFLGVGKKPINYTPTNPDSASFKIPFSNRVGEVPGPVDQPGANAQIAGLIQWPERIINGAIAETKTLATGGTADVSSKGNDFKLDAGNFIDDAQKMTESLMAKGWSSTGSVLVSSLVGTIAGSMEQLPAIGFAKNLLSKIARNAVITPVDHIALWEQFGSADSIKDARSIRNALLLDLGNKSGGLSTPEAAKIAADINQSFNKLEELGIPKMTGKFVAAANDLNALLETDVKKLGAFSRPSQIKNFTPAAPRGVLTETTGQPEAPQAPTSLNVSATDEDIARSIKASVAEVKEPPATKAEEPAKAPAEKEVKTTEKAESTEINPKDFKTADEYISKHITIDHATNGEIKFGSTGAYFAPEGGADRGMGSKVETRYIKPSAKVFTVPEGSTYQYLEKRGLLDEKSDALYNKYGYSTLRELRDNLGELKNPNDAFLELQKKAIPMIAKETGADVIKLTGEDDLNPTQYVVQNKEALATKDELEEKYKSSQKTESLAEEAKKYKSAEEFADHYIKNQDKIPSTPEYKGYLQEQGSLIKRENEIYAKLKSMRDKYADKTLSGVPPKDIGVYDSLQKELNQILSKKTMAKSPDDAIKTHIGEKALRSQLTDIYNKSVGKNEGKEKKDVASLEKEVISLYKSAGMSEAYPEFSKAEEALSGIMQELELSKAGERLMTGYGIDAKVTGIPSTFPKWIPEELRSKELFTKVFKGLDLDNLKYPEGNRTRQRALFDTVLNELDAQLGIDTSEIRGKIKQSYETKNDKPGEIAKADSRSTQGSKGGIDIEEATRNFAGEVAKKPYLTKEEMEKAPAYDSSGNNASIGLYRDNAPVEIGHLKDIKPIEMPELVDLSRELMNEVPKIKQRMTNALGYFKPVGEGSISLRADLFSKENSQHLAKTLAHEIGHLVDYLPERSLKRGNILGRLRSLSRYMKETFDDGETGVIKSKEIRKELLDLTQYWKPYDVLKSSPNYVKYRQSSKELYADAISVLLNSPGTIERMAPKFYKAFFDALDAKPEVRDAYFDLQARMSGDRETLIEKRREGVRGMFKEGDMKASDIQHERVAVKKARDRDLVFRFKYELVDKNQALIDRINRLEKDGVKIPDDENPLYFLEERSYLGGKQKALMETYFSPIYKNLSENNISWTDFGEVLFYRRIVAGDRSEVANPRGITPDAAKELLTDVSNKLSATQNKVLTESLAKFHEGQNKIIDEAYEEGMIKPEMYASMKKNTDYAAFRVIDHLEDNVTSKLYHSIGTLKDITNPADASIMKTLAVMRAVENQKVKRVSIDFLKENFPEDVQPAKKVFSGKGMQFMESKKEFEELVTLYSKEEKGKMEGYYVDPYIKTSLNNESVGGKNIIVSTLKLVNGKLFRPLFIGFNPGFQAFNFIRDLERFWKNTPGMTLPRTLKLYSQSLSAAKVRAFGIPENASPAMQKAIDTIRTMEESQILSVTYNDLIAGESDDDKQIQAILHHSGIDSFAPEPKMPPGVPKVVMMPILHTLDFIKKVGDLVETIPKVAGYYEFTKGGTVPISKSQASFLRKNIGSPDFLAGGHLKPATNEIFLFSNAITQGVRSDFNVATDPKTRAGFWWKTAKINLTPKILMYLASIGILGASTKEVMDGVSEYDKTNYNIIPIGIDENGKSIYIRIPPDESGRLIAGLMWKILNAPHNDQGVFKNIADIASYTGGQLPSLNPTLQDIQAIGQFVSGQNPYDFFRNRNILSDDVYKAGGSEATKQFLGWIFNQNGGSVFVQLYNDPSVPTPQTPMQKIFNIPVAGNVLGRFVRVSNYGITEQLKDAKGQATKEDAQRRLDEKKLVNSYVQKYQNKLGTADELSKQLVEERIGHAPATDEEDKTATRLENKFNESIKKGGGNPYVSALLDATSNNEKLAILREVKNRMTDAQYTDFKKQISDEKIVSDDVVQKVEDGKTPEYKDGEKKTQSGLIDSVMTYAEAIGTDPVTAFNRIFTGQTIRRVDNGTIIVERMSLDDSSQVKRDGGGNNPTMKLDHTVPLELGGSNARDNLKLVPTADWQSYTPVENFLGKALRAKEITKKEAQDLITKFKKKEMTAQDVFNYKMNAK